MKPKTASKFKPPLP